MKKTILLTLALLSSVAHAATTIKLSDLPLKSASGTNSTDSFPYVDAVAGTTDRLELSDLVNLPSLATILSGKATTSNPIFTGNVSAFNVLLTGSLGIGTTNPGFDIDVQSSNSSSIVDTTFGGSGPTFAGRRAGGSQAAPAATPGGDSLLTVSGRGYHTDGTPGFFGSNARMTFFANENFTQTSSGTYIAFSTTPDGSTGILERVRIGNDGSVGIGTTNPSSALQVVGTTTSTAFVGPLTGNSDTSTTATHVGTSVKSDNVNYFPLFTNASSSSQGVDLGTGMTFNPSTNTLSTTTFSGNATSCTNQSGGSVSATTGAFSGTLNVNSGSVTTLSGPVTVGSGGTGNNVYGITISGSSASNFGPYVQLNRNSVAKGFMGTESAVLGFSSDEITLNAVTGNTVSLSVASTDVLVGSASGVSLLGTNTNNSASAGFVGEYVESVISTATNFPGATTAWGDATSISLTAGDWDVTFMAYTTLNGAVLTNQVLAGISTTTGNSSTGLIPGSNETSVPIPTSTADRGAQVADYRMSLSGTTTVYGKLLTTYSVGNPQFTCRLSARRRR